LTFVDIQNAVPVINCYGLKYYKILLSTGCSDLSKLVSFNTENSHDADLLDHANKLDDFSGWVKEQLNEDMKEKNGSQ
jgi:hypothetical protein